jgi:hypothetical protein
MIRRILLLLAATLALSPVPAVAWWDYGHKTIARIAMLEVSPATRTQILRLLRNARQLDTPTCAAVTLEDASVWPDCIRAQGDRFSYTATWHYQNVNVCRPFDLETPCRDGNCVSAQIERHLRLLKDRALPARERLASLAFLVHFVGDMHQPMHAGDRADRGGNSFPAFYSRIRSNLHSIWDGYLAERAISTPMADARGILTEHRDDRETLRQGTVPEWAEEAWAVSRRFAYGTMLSDPCAEVPADPPVLSQAQIAELVPVVRLQIARGGLRLARLLDEAFAPQPPATAERPWRRTAQ